MSFELNKNQKHDVQLLSIGWNCKDDDNRSRLSESIDTALNLSEGLVQIEVDEDSSAAFLIELFMLSVQLFSNWVRTRMFSNNPFGACEKCDGLGVIQYFDKNKLISDDSANVNEGAIKGWNEADSVFTN